MPRALLGDVELFYTDVGDGEPLLLVHGLAADSHDWNWQIPALAERHRVVAVDLRGHGRSSAPATGYAITTYADDLVLLLDHLEIDCAIVVGHSLGGLMVADLAIRHPDRVRALVEVDPAYGYDPAWPAGFIEVARAIDEKGVSALADTLDAFWTAETPPNLRSLHRRRILGGTPHVLSQSTVAWASSPGVVADEASRDYLQRRKCPVLAIYADPERCAFEESTFGSDASRTIAFAGCGHWLQQERPDEFNEAVLAWIADLPHLTVPVSTPRFR
jgi:pimeloyl-ACP methyl ester carboxylesterase